MKSVAQDVIMISNSKEDPSLKNEGMVDNSSVRVCHTKGQSSRHAMWASTGLKVCMFLERGLQRVVNLKKGQQSHRLQRGSDQRLKRRTLSAHESCPRNDGSDDHCLHGHQRISFFFVIFNLKN